MHAEYICPAFRQSHPPIHPPPNNNTLLPSLDVVVHNDSCRYPLKNGENHDLESIVTRVRGGGGAGENHPRPWASSSSKLEDQLYAHPVLLR